ncbi:hypothetical protein FN846DRAFT_903818 [Sphaerosporella brunnea]|uniref:Uncharacterized protein n=1 Tax=Sphaerosporella brunnea TaxID=1250544 RepID=A0A5J5F5T6_9PEZI|nr:hypothetical protein FN846DRAFT_903818 [Sphaerosporella brunnea]
MSEQHYKNDDRRPSTQPVPDWLLDFCPCTTGTKTTTKGETGFKEATWPSCMEDFSNREPSPSGSALLDLYISLGPCVFWPTLLDTHPNRSGFKPGTAECARQRSFSPLLRGQTYPGTGNAELAQVIDAVDLRGIWERSPRDAKTARAFQFNPESLEFRPEAFNTLEHLSSAVEEACRARSKAPRGWEEWRNAEIRFVAALKKRSRYLVALREPREG